MTVRALSDDGFAAATGRGRWLVVVTATWCAPCRNLTPVLEALGAGRRGLNVGTLDLDRCPLTALALKVRGVPHLVLIDAGATLATRTGHAPLPTLTAWIDQFLKPGRK